MQNIIYRLTIYDDNNSPLTPATGSGGSAIHSDPFVVTTYPVSGAKEYITQVRPGGGKAVIPDTKWQVGKYYIELADIRTGSSNLERWVTAFVGDGEGRFGLLGKKASVEESLDNGSNWTTQFVGRVVNFNNISSLKWTIELSDESDRLQRVVFPKVPKILNNTNVTRKLLFPLAYDNTPEISSTKLSTFDKANAEFILGPYASIFTAFSAGVIKIKNIFPYPIEKKYTYQLTPGIEKYCRQPLRNEGFPSFIIDLLTPSYAICRIYNSSDVLIGDFAVYDYTTYTEQTDDGDKTYIDSFAITSIDPLGLRGGAAISSIPSGTIKIQIIPPDTEEGIKDYPYLVSPTGSGTVIDVLRDALDGYYDQLFNTGSYIPIVYNESNFSNIETIRNTTDSSSVDKFNPDEKFFLINKQEKMHDFIEENIMKPNGLGYYLKPALSGSVPVSEFNLFTFDRPTATPATEIQDEHVLSVNYINWKVDLPLKINRTFKYLAYTPIASTNIEVSQLIDRQNIEIDTKALINNTFSDHTINPNVVSILDSNTTQVTRNIPRELSGRFLKGIPILQLEVARGYYESLEIGDWVTVDIQWQPNIGTLKRGGSRLMQIVSKVANGLKLQFELIDSGLNEQHGKPSSISISAADGLNATIQVQYTGSKTGLVATEYAITDTNSLPSEYSNKWIVLSKDELSATNTTATNYVNNVGVNQYVFARARTESGEEFKLPSDYIYSSGVATTTLSAPSSLSLVTASYYTAEVSWSASPSFSAEVYSTNNEAGSIALYATVPPQTSNITISGYDLAPTSGQVVGIRFIDNRGGASPTSSITFSRGAALNPAPDLAGIFIFTDAFL